ncbi:MAG: cell division protein FtsQ/DivIB [Desulfobacteria bacterium]|nr:FtsQ-type POTRA domain-containing protein [Desulfobacterales bacterium]
MAKKNARRNVYKKSAGRKMHRVRRVSLFLLKAFLVLGSVAILSSVMIFCHDLLTQSACFEIRTVLIEGCRRISPSEVREWAELDQKTNILSVNIKALQRRLTGHPWIKSADIRREIPSTLHMKVLEYTPVAIVDCGRRLLIDDTGRIFKKVDHGEEIRVPVVTGLRMSDIEVDGGNASPFLETVLAVTRLARAEGSILPFGSISAIHLDKEIGLTIYAFDSDTAIKLGFENYPEKFNRLREMMPYIESQQGMLHVKSVDLKDTRRVVVKQRDLDSKEV